MKAVILSAGTGTKIRNLFPNTPKAMVQINGRPILEHHIKHLKKYGVKNSISTCTTYQRLLKTILPKRLLDIFNKYEIR